MPFKYKYMDADYIRDEPLFFEGMGGRVKQFSEAWKIFLAFRLYMTFFSGEQ